ncbi:pseudaminic acid cytidylyltransferase [Agaribacter flavus]|uniref:Pseudaminic acid cytidylyltransferase n=1 Tax=Agaribacter flavus TaxID=1902781 RepID=A0ABV7FNG5_9ALTE
MGIAIIPARGGSKRIPRKNIKAFNGKPLIAYSIDTAKQSGAFSHLLVSTDDEAIAKTALQYGADGILSRPAALADDFATTGDVMQQALQTIIAGGYESIGMQENIDLVCCLYATAPLLQSAYLRRAVDMFHAEIRADKSTEYVFSATSFAFPVQRGFSLQAGKLKMLYPELMQTRSQDLPDVYHDAGQFYIANSEVWLAKKPVFTEHSKPIMLPRYLVQDIDTLEDWTQAELLHDAIARKTPYA